MCVCAYINSKWCNNNNNIYPDSGKTRGGGVCVCVPTLTASGVTTTTTSTLTPERREAVVCVCVCAYINSKWCNNNNNIHPDSGKTRGDGVCVPALTASGVTTTTTSTSQTKPAHHTLKFCLSVYGLIIYLGNSRK